MSVSDFYISELDKLNIEFNKINLFTKHPPTLGTYREQILKSYLRQFIPDALTLKSGFVYNNENGNYDDMYSSQTKQIDCMIFDNVNYTPYLKTNDFEIICPEALYAGIEIKSTLTLCKSFQKSTVNQEEYKFTDVDGRKYKWAGTLIDALQNIKSIWDNANYTNKQIFLAIFAYSCTFKPELLYKALDNEEIQEQLEIEHLNQLPIYICVPNEFLIYFSQTPFDADYSECYDPYETVMTVIEPRDVDRAFGLQLFTIALKINVDYKLSNIKPNNTGLFSCGKGTIGVWSNHFHLKSD